uniref:Uncharacterized protein n=1 Tax=Pithovirus LCPAC304 TaxID=2506594 RepID=A0A481Z997_9VIRU|nr:MAG: hypothetical protein LCPAC304_00050 [Pithovirus LCPAC304]
MEKRAFELLKQGVEGHTLCGMGFDLSEEDRIFVVDGKQYNALLGANYDKPYGSMFRAWIDIRENGATQRSVEWNEGHCVHDETASPCDCQSWPMHVLTERYKRDRTLKDTL